MSQQLIIIPEDINILLLGENDVGKSTFIQAFANYMIHDQFTKAKNKIIHYFPTSLFTTDTSQVKKQNTNVNRNIKSGARKLSSNSTSNSLKSKCVKDGNKTFDFFSQLSKNCSQQEEEEEDVDEIASKSACSYLFFLPKYGRRVHLIDTPGFKVTSKIFEDKYEFGDVLSYINRLEHLHAICLVLKPSSSYSELHLEYLVKFLLSIFEKSASKNIIFLFTHSRDIDRSQEDAEPLLNDIFAQIRTAYPRAEVKFGNENVFYVDNEAFHFLESSKDVASLSDVMKTNFEKIWSDSVAECWRMIKYILGKDENLKEIVPHKVKNTITLYNSREIITQLSQTLTDIEGDMDHVENHSIVLTKEVWSKTKKPINMNEEIYSAMRNSTFDYINHLDIVELEEAKNLIESFEKQKSDYKNSKKWIVSSLEKFAAFVKFNAILPYNDAYETYIKYLITQEIENADGNTSTQVVKRYNDSLKQCTEETHIINTSCYSYASPITTTDILNAVVTLTIFRTFQERFQKIHD